VQAKTVAVNNWRREVAQKKSQVTVQKDQVTAAVADLRKERSRLEREYATLEQNSREITSYLRQVQGTTSGRQRMQKPYSGTFTRPVPGAISSSFGSRMHPILRVRKMHTGVDMRASSGTPIRAAGDGTVVRAERWGGYGNCIIIDHGGGTATVYAHCSRMSVRSGQAVKRGQTIGAVGSTGLSTGPHLHFEVRRNGSPVNPASYIN
jgi:murein DD-endopeptidase MepM/ murein hydrolase activator NlpD